GTGWAGGIGRRVFGPLGVTAAEELGAGRALAVSGVAPAVIAGAFGGSAAPELPSVGTAARRPEEPQPVASVTARSSATTVTPAAQFGRRGSGIRRVWAKSRSLGQQRRCRLRPLAGGRACCWQRRGDRSAGRVDALPTVGLDPLGVRAAQFLT